MRAFFLWEKPAEDRARISPISGEEFVVFTGCDFVEGCSRMRSLFEYLDLWEPVSKGFSEDESRGGDLKEIKKGDAKALFLIQQSVSDSIYPRISEASTSREAWEILKEGFRGENSAMMAKLQTRGRGCETLSMKPEESVQDYTDRVSTLITQMRSYGENIPERNVVEKILRSLPPKFDYVVTAIEESRDLSTCTQDQLLGSLLAREDRASKSSGESSERRVDTTYTWGHEFRRVRSYQH